MQTAHESLRSRFVARSARGFVAGIVLFWLGAIVLVRGEAGVPAWWLPVALALGFVLPAPCLPPSVEPRGARVWRQVAVLALAVALAALVYGALATPSRHWDGAAAFDAKVHWLTHAATLQQPFFADPAVFHHSPDYPLLLPLLVATAERLLGGGLGRLWLPAIWLLLLLVAASTLRRAGCERRLSWVVVLAVGLTPALLGPGGGAVDSGYSDALLLLATTTIAAGLLLASPIELAIGVLLAVACKPEGLVYVAAAAWVAFVAGQRRSLLTMLGALVVGLVVWLPTQRQLLHQPAEGTAGMLAVVVAVLVAGAAGGLGVDALARRTRCAGRWRWLAAFAGCGALLVLLPLLGEIVPANSAIGVYLHRGERWQQGLANLPAFAFAFIDYAFLRLHFGATFGLALLLLVRRSGKDAAGVRVLATFLVVGLVTTALPFVLTHEADVQHHLRSSLPRLLLHWLGPAWLLVGCRLSPWLASTRAGAVVPAAPS